MLGRPRPRLVRAVRVLFVSMLLGALLVTTGFGLVTDQARADTPGQPALTVPLAELGRSDTIQLDPPPSSQTLTLPVPPGLRPTRLLGTIEVTADGPGGILEVSGPEGRLASVDLRKASGTDVALSVDLSTVPVTGNSVALTFRLGDPDDQCVDAGTFGSVLRNLRLAYDGTDTPPTTIATFLPPALQQLTIAVPATADLSVRDAAVRLASAVAARYSPAAPAVRVVELPAAGLPAQRTALHRAVAFTGSSAAGLELGADRVLIVNGSGSALAAQVDALFGDLGTIAVASRATVSHPQSAPQLPPATQTVSQLGLGAPTATGRGTATVRMGVDAASLGQPASGWTTHLVGTVVTGGVGTGDRRGSLTLTVGDRVLGSWPVTHDGGYDVTVTVPQDLLSRYTELVLTATADGSYGCAARPVVTVAVDPDSTIAARPADQPSSGGFADLPAALRPSYDLATDRDGIAGLGQVVGLAVALQRLSAPTLVPHLVETDALLTGSGPGVLVVHGLAPAAVDLPLDLTADTATLPGGEQLTADTQLATLQQGAIGSRSVTVVSGTDPALVDGLLGWLGRPANLASLSGDVAVWTGAEPVDTLALRVSADQTQTTQRAWPYVVIAAVAFAVILASVVATVMILRRRRSRRLGAPGPDEDLPDGQPTKSEPTKSEPTRSEPTRSEPAGGESTNDGATGGESSDPTSRT